MADYTWPSTIYPTDNSFYLQHSTSRFQSEFTRQVQTLALSAPRWVCQATFSPLHGNKQGEMDALIAKLKGGANRVQIYDWRRPSPLGSWTSHDTYAATVPTTDFTDGTDFTDDTGFLVNGRGEPRFLGGTQGSESIYVKGFSPEGIQARPGDYIGMGDGRIHMVTEAFTADAQGEGTLYFTPPLAADVTAGEFVFQQVSGWFRLVSDDAGMNPTTPTFLSSYTLDFVEDL